MIAKALRWGMGGGGFACGPIPGDILVELMVADEGESKFIFMANCGEGIELKVGTVPFFDIFRFASDNDFDVEEAIGKIDSFTEEQYGAVWGDEFPEEADASKYSGAFRLAFAALEEFSNNEDADLEDFFANYEDVEIESLDLPEISLDDEDEE